MTRCIVCDSKNLSRKLYNNHTVGRALNFVRQVLGRKNDEEIPFTGSINICSACGHGVMDSPPTPGQLVEYYERGYWSSRPALADKVNITKDAYKNDLRAHYQIEFILDHLTVDSISEVLEIGAGPAFASLALREKCHHPLELNVCEPGETWKEYYKESHINNVSGFFPFETNKKFDYIHTSHWLEHVSDLNGTMLRLNQVLNPGGFIFVEVPNTEYYYWDLPLKDTPHIQFFTKSSLTKIFQKNGFKCLKLGTFGQTFYEKHKGVPISERHYKATEKGFWIRSLFRKE